MKSFSRMRGFINWEEHAPKGHADPPAAALSDCSAQNDANKMRVLPITSPGASLSFGDYPRCPRFPRQRASGTHVPCDTLKDQGLEEGSWVSSELFDSRSVFES